MPESQRKLEKIFSLILAGVKRNPDICYSDLRAGSRNLFFLRINCRCQATTKQAGNAKKHYLANKSTYKERAVKHSAEAKKRNKEYVLNHFLLNPCVDCSEADPVVLEFDHVRGEKRGNVSDGVRVPWVLERLKEEIAKCDVRCANCHRRITHQRRQNINGVLD